ncbi:MFS transporter [Nocardioides panzhihuensis]|uniref:Putative proline/betaine transporter n=1 Tax=Nocardioides panzhihuensis TaxID=860243 RepID=A0A7Z0DSZ5_9ACTN|nr:MFS transporter [Nocardioides panzhihuensis]NYI80776.1 MHS family alpha-ketoglutarate permease-like MFS transporter [Nocardioides panzhihuensis]
MNPTQPPAAATPAVTPSPTQPTKARVILGTALGNAVEWYDWNVYAIFVPFFATQFFDPANPTAAVLSTLAIFAVGFVMRPLGAVLFGSIADRKGRRLALMLAVGLAALGSLVIGLSPTYESVGLAAPVVLVVARLIQGLAHGGEMPSSHAYIAEMAPAERRGLWSSSIYVSGMSAVLVATLLGAVLTSTLGEGAMADWGWRIPFLIGGALGLVVLWVRRRLPETEAYEMAHEDTSPEVGLMQGLWQNRVSVLRVLGITIGGTVFFYTWSIAGVAYAVNVKGMAASQAMWSGVIGTSITILCLPFIASLSDRWGRRPHYFIFGIGAAVVSFPLSRLIQGEMWQLTVALTVTMLLSAFTSAIVPAVLSELFPTHVRATGMGLPYALAVAVFGGTAPYLQTWLAGHGLDQLFLAYSAVLALVTAAVMFFAPETCGKALE